MEHKGRQKGPRRLFVLSVSLLLVLVAIVAIGKANLWGPKIGPPPRVGVAAAPTNPNVRTTPQSTPSYPTSSAIFNVESYGADPTGKRDSTVAIQEAIAAAETKPGSEVYFPPGRFILDQPSHKLFTFVIDKPIAIVGAGINQTTIINEVGKKTPGVKLSRDMFAIEVAPGQQTGGGSGSVITNMTLDSATYDAGTDIMDFANHTTLSNLKVLAAKSTNTYNYNSFGIRVIAICNPSTASYIYRVDNVIHNVTIIGQGYAGTTELDLSCQVGTTASNINITGNGIDVFYSHNDAVSHAHLVGGADGSTHFYTWVITGSFDIDLAHITTNGIGGVIAPDVKLVSHNINISNETMLNKSAYLYIGDSRNVTISRSALGGIAVLPRDSVSGLHVKYTTYSSVRCKPSVVISGLSGLACP